MSEAFFFLGSYAVDGKPVAESDRLRLHLVPVDPSQNRVTGPWTIEVDPVALSFPMRDVISLRHERNTGLVIIETLCGDMRGFAPHTGEFFTRFFNTLMAEHP